MVETKVLNLMRIKGPIVPTQLCKEIQKDSLLTSAILSQLASVKKVLISKLKVGGSPLYYLDGQQQRLQSFVKYLEEKDQRTVALLREKKILRDDSQEPLVRVSLREIKDFAVPLHVTLDNKKLLFWKWYLMPDTEAEPVIKQALGLEPKKEPPAAAPAPVPEQPTPKPEHPPTPVTPPKKEVTHQSSKPQPPTPEIMNSESPKPSTQETLAPDTSEFFLHLKNFFSKSRITLHHSLRIKKTEYEFELAISSPVGPLQYYCKAIQKAKVNEKDLSEVLVKAMFRKLPPLILITGELTKKAKELLQQEAKGLTVKQV